MAHEDLDWQAHCTIHTLLYFWCNATSQSFYGHQFGDECVCDQGEFGDKWGDLDVWAASLGAGMAFSSWSEAHMPAAAKAVIAREMRNRVLAGSTKNKRFLSLRKSQAMTKLTHQPMTPILTSRQRAWYGT